MKIRNYSELRQDCLLSSVVDLEVHITRLASGALCKLCGHVVKQMRSMYEHLNSVHFYDGKNYHCPRCPYTARTLNPFRQHVNKKHIELKGLNYDECIVYEDQKL